MEGRTMKYLRNSVIFGIAICIFLSFMPSFADSVIHTDDMYTPRGMFHDEKNGRIVFADRDANAIFELNLSTLKVKRIAGKSLGKNAYDLPVGGYLDKKSEESLFKNPSDVVVLNTGAIVVADTGNHAIRQIYQGKVTTIAGGKEAGLSDGLRQNTQFNYPSGLAVSNGIIYVADTENNAIRKIQADGRVETLKVKINKPSGIHAYNGDLYVTSMEDHKIYVIKKEKTVTPLPEGSSGEVRDGYRDGRIEFAEFSVPSDVFVSGDRIYVADAGNHAVRKIVDQKLDKGKKIKVVQTAVGGKIGFSDEKNNRLLLDTPRSVLVIGSKLYVADTDNARILVFDNANKLLAVNYEKCEDPNSAHIYVDGSKIEPLDAAPTLRKGVTYLPVRLLIENIGGEVKWIAEEKAVLCKYGDKEIKIGKDKSINVSGRTLVPLRYLAEALGLNVEWNGEYRSVIITTY